MIYIERNTSKSDRMSTISITTQGLVDLIKLCKSTLTSESVNGHDLNMNIGTVIVTHRQTSDSNDLDLNRVQNLAMTCDIHELLRLFIQVIITNPLSDDDIKEYVNEYLDDLRDQLEVSLRASWKINHVSKFIGLVDMIKNAHRSPSQSTILKELTEYGYYLLQHQESNARRGGGGLPTYWRKRYLNEIREIVNRV